MITLGILTFDFNLSKSDIIQDNTRTLKYFHSIYLFPDPYAAVLVNFNSIFLPQKTLLFLF